MLCGEQVDNTHIWSKAMFRRKQGNKNPLVYTFYIVDPN